VLATGNPFELTAYARRAVVVLRVSSHSLDPRRSARRIEMHLPMSELARVKLPEAFLQKLAHAFDGG
jgi:hypothetical protein